MRQGEKKENEGEAKKRGGMRKRGMKGKKKKK